MDSCNGLSFLKPWLNWTSFPDNEEVKEEAEKEEEEVYKEDMAVKMETSKLLEDNI